MPPARAWGIVAAESRQLKIECRQHGLEARVTIEFVIPRKIGHAARMSEIPQFLKTTIILPVADICDTLARYERALGLRDGTFTATASAAKR